MTSTFKGDVQIWSMQFLNPPLLNHLINPLMAEYSDRLNSGTEKNILLNQSHHIIPRNHA